MVSFTASLPDALPILTVSCVPTNGSTFAKGTNTVTCTATDASGNTANCSFTVAVNDTLAPVVTCPGNIVTNTAAGQCSQIVSFAPTATDNCPGVTVSCSPISGSVFTKGTNSVTCTATDSSGNTADCSFTVAVNDGEFPVVTCPFNIVTNTVAGQCSQVVVFDEPTATDNCPGVTISCSPTNGSAFASGTNTVTCTATDASGNTTNCSFTVVVQ